MHEVLTWHSILDLVSQEPTGTNLQPHPHENAFKNWNKIIENCCEK